MSAYYTIYYIHQYIFCSRQDATDVKIICAKAAIKIALQLRGGYLCNSLTIIYSLEQCKTYLLGCLLRNVLSVFRLIYNHFDEIHLTK